MLVKCSRNKPYEDSKGRSGEARLPIYLFQGSICFHGAAVTPIAVIVPEGSLVASPRSYSPPKGPHHPNGQFTRTSQNCGVVIRITRSQCPDIANLGGVAVLGGIRARRSNERTFRHD